MTKCTMADKSTKTDDVLLNGELELSCPTTTNAATMTTVVQSEAPVRSAPVVASTSTRNVVHTQMHRQDSRVEQQQRQTASSPAPNVSIFCFMSA